MGLVPRWTRPAVAYMAIVDMHFYSDELHQIKFWFLRRVKRPDAAGPCLRHQKTVARATSAGTNMATDASE